MKQYISTFISLIFLMSLLPGAFALPKNIVQKQRKPNLNGLSGQQSVAYDILIVAGQSNAVGCGLGPGDAFQPDERIQMMTTVTAKSSTKFQIAPAAELDLGGGELVGNFWLPFARLYIENGLLRPGRKLLILQSAVGGTGFLDNRWGLRDDLNRTMLDMIDAALALNPDNELKALLWHQGETDAILKASHTVHLANLGAFVCNVRDRYGEDLPFIAGDFVQQWETDNAQLCAPVVAAIRAVCGISNAVFVETSGLLSNEQAIRNTDTIHFSRAAQDELGRRYFKAYQKITAGANEKGVSA